MGRTPAFRAIAASRRISVVNEATPCLDEVRAQYTLVFCIISQRVREPSTARRTNCRKPFQRSRKELRRPQRRVEGKDVRLTIARSAHRPQAKQASRGFSLRLRRTSLARAHVRLYALNATRRRSEPRRLVARRRPSSASAIPTASSSRVRKRRGAQHDVGQARQANGCPRRRGLEEP